MPSRFGVNAQNNSPPGRIFLADSFDSSLFAAVDAAANAPAPIAGIGAVGSDVPSSTPALPESRSYMPHDGDTLFSNAAQSLDYLGVPAPSRNRERSVTDAPLPTFLPVGAAPGARMVRTSSAQQAESLLARPRAISVGTLDDPVAPQPLVPGKIRPPLRIHRATQSMDIKSRAPGHGRTRAGTISTSGVSGAWGNTESAPVPVQPREKRSPDTIPRTVSIRPLSPEVSSQTLQNLLEPFGTIERIDLSERGVARVRFSTSSQALRVRDEGNARLGPLLAEMLPGQAANPRFSLDYACAIQIAPVPPGATNGLMQLLTQYGRVESIVQIGNGLQAVFDSPDAAESASRALHGMNMFGEPLRAVVTDSPVPTVHAPPLGNVANVANVANVTGTPAETPRRVPVACHGGAASIVPSNDKGGVPLPAEYVPRVSPSEQAELMSRLRFVSGENPPLDTAARESIKYNTTITPVSDASRSTRRFDNARYRELRKNLEAGNLSQAQADSAAIDNLGDIVELASNYVGNTLVQRFFEQCSDPVKMRMLVPLAPHLATIGIHKNGTWAAQKIIDCAKTDEQQELICKSLLPYVPVLLLDQFGNYVVQCLLPYGFPRVDFIFDAMVDRCWEIGQGRFGARSMRTCLENPTVPRKHLKRLAYAIVLHCVPLATSSNGTLLLTWLLDNSNLADIYGLLAPRMVPHVAQLCTHKLASGTMLRIMHQTDDPASANLLLGALFDLPEAAVLESVLLDPVHGSQLIGRALMSPNIDAAKRHAVVETLTVLLRSHDLVNVPAYRRLVEQVGLVMPIYPVYPQTVYRDDANDLSMYMNSLNLQNTVVPMYPGAGKDDARTPAAYGTVGMPYSVPYGGMPVGMPYASKPPAMAAFPTAGGEATVNAGASSTLGGSADTRRI
ncbi:hypothetical protein MCUN1_002906 [Malassezia cuniculi]|uniref:RRM domain-containing protein n=1 Tax=Malassezia cuniculi TaxID=948313 RepID=A0AAF0EVX2_9BASI|nr:hypothetical protein MCUN1_002906 [Malassezia cuniculi]